jgi:hypothetical protein
LLGPSRIDFVELVKARSGVEDEVKPVIELNKRRVLE